LANFDFIFGGNVKNNGYQNVVPSDNATFEVRIEQDINGTWTPLYSQLTNIDTVIAGSDGQIIIDTLTDASWVTTGDFRAVYKVFSPLDQNIENDSVFNYFTITPDNYASKVPLDNMNYPEATSSAFPFGTWQKYEFGSVFNFPSAGSSLLQIDSLSYAFRVRNSYAGNNDLYVRLNVYEWADGSGVGVLNGLPEDFSEFSLVASGIDTLQGLISMAGSYGVSTASIEDITSQTPYFEMQDSKFYYISISLESGLNGFTDFDQNNMIWIGTSDSYSYALNLIPVNATNPISMPFSLHLTDNFSIMNSYFGFSGFAVPSIGVHLSANCVQSIADFDTTVDYLQVSFTDATNPSTSGGTVTAWSWDFGDGNTSTMQNPSHIYADSGTYIVCLTIFDNCGSSTTCDTISVDKDYTGLQDNWIENVSVYPIPASDYTVIDGLQFGGLFTVEIIDLAGKVVRTFNFNGENSITLDLSKELSGSYLLRIGDAEIKGTKSILILK